MKTNTLYTFLFLLSLNFFHLQAQISNDTIRYKKPPKWSLKIGLNYGSFNGLNAQISYFIKEKYSISFNTWHISRESDNTPFTYYSNSFLSDEKIHSVWEHLKSYGLSGGYLIQIPNTRSRVHLMTGLYYNIFEYPDDFKKKDNSGLFSNLFDNSNYTYKMYQKKYISLVISPAFEFPIFNHFGMSLQPTVIIGSKQTNFLFNISINFGNATSKPLKKRKKKN